MAKFQIVQNMGWANVDVTDVLAPMAAQIAAQMRPGKPAGFYDGVRFSVNKRAGSVVIGIATAELDRIDADAAKVVKASADKGSAAVANETPAQRIARLQAALAAAEAEIAAAEETVEAKAARLEAELAALKAKAGAVKAPGRRAGKAA